MKPEPAPCTGGALPRGPPPSGPGMPKRRKKSKNGSFGDSPPWEPGWAFSTTSTFTTAGPYLSTSGEKSGRFLTRGSALAAAAGAACALAAAAEESGRGVCALRSLEQAPSAIDTHSRDTTRRVGRETLMLDSERRHGRSETGGSREQFRSRVS